MFSISIWRLILLLIVVLFLSNLYKEKKHKTKSEKFSNYRNTSSQSTLMCAKNCCYSGWPASIDIDESAFGIEKKYMRVKYRATNLKCNNGFTTGCVCDSI
jgi:hypothetical protein